MKFVPNSVTRTLGRQLLIAQKHSPHILFGAGVAGVIASTVLACRATLKLSDTLDTIQEDVGRAKYVAASKAELVHHDKADVVAMQGRSMASAYAHGSLSIVKLYGPAVLIGAASVGALTGSHVALTRRNMALTAGYSALMKAYDDYRERVRDEVGKDREIELYHGARLAEVTQEDGTSKVDIVVDPKLLGSPYAKFFDDYNRHWKKNSETNHYFLQAQQNYANHLLQTRGHVFLNEVYRDLGFEHTQAGAVVGWIRGEGDNYIDFGLFDARNSNFINGWERSILLDFNVDGIIYDKI